MTVSPETIFQLYAIHILLGVSYTKTQVPSTELLKPSMPHVSIQGHIKQKQEKLSSSNNK